MWQARDRPRRLLAGSPSRIDWPLGATVCDFRLQNGFYVNICISSNAADGESTVSPSAYRGALVVYGNDGRIVDAFCLFDRGSRVSVFSLPRVCVSIVYDFHPPLVF